MPFENDMYKSTFSVDNVIFGFDKDHLKILLIKRKEAPFVGHWALPGDLVKPDEDLRASATRVLFELTGLKNLYLEQVFTFGKIDRHPFGRVITVAYNSLISINEVNIRPSSFAESVEWREVRSLETLAFDHLKIVETCLDKLQRELKFKPIGFELLPQEFTLTELQKLYEAVIEKELDKRNFRKKILSMNILSDRIGLQKNVNHRPAKLYSFDAKKYEIAKKNGFIFEL